MLNTKWNMSMRQYQEWLRERWDGYPLERMLDDAMLPKTSVVLPDELLNAWRALRSLNIISNGLNGEAGEASEHFKKWVRDGKLNKYEAGIELGDTLNYLIWLAATLGYSLEDIAQMSKAKLTAHGKKGDS